MLFKCRSVQDLLLSVQIFIKIDHILNMQWRFVPHGTLGNERVNMSPEAKLPE